MKEIKKEKKIIDHEFQPFTITIQIKRHASKHEFELQQIVTQ